MRKKHAKIRRSMIHCHLFRMTWLVQRSGTKQSAADWYTKKMGIKRIACPEGPLGSVLYHTNHRDCLIWLSQDTGAATISHELLHAMVRLSQILKIRINSGTEELFAYYQGWLTLEIVQRLYE